MSPPFLPDDPSISDTTPQAPVPQTPISSSLILSNLIPAFLILIYTLYIFYQIRRHNLLIRIKEGFRICHQLFWGRKWVWSRGRQRMEGYVGVDTNFQSDKEDDEGIELEDQQRIELALERGECDSHGYSEDYQLIDDLSSDTETDVASKRESCGSNYIYKHLNGSDGSTVSAQNDADSLTQTRQTTANKLGMSGYFDPETSRLREGALLDIGVQVHEGKNMDDGSFGAWVHITVDSVVDRAIRWLEH
ncbi:hypothetical protein AJ79_01863 [Helicocarpus griseus UAMH5409]|uniref:Uncharacterized protein n=1 Tax=Helicocarpus griseus UAMH5409 TaxID=1447875 RepID=A0A2B7Y5N4_9EURO|nr:hypothetical protein AJ79_01863 [Helicocarpus griseus UAMH5409]